MVLHASPDKKLDLLIGMLLAESEELDDPEVGRAGGVHATRPLFAGQ